jgi:hypothetical protein
MRRFRIGFAWIAVATVILLGGLAISPSRVAAAPDHITYRFRLPWALLLGSAAAALVVSGVTCGTAEVGLLRLFAALPAAMASFLFVVAYDLSRTHVTLTPTTMTLPAAGILREHPTVAYDEIRVVVISREQLVLHLKDDRDVAIPRGDLVRAAADDLLAALERNRVTHVHLPPASARP